MNIYIGIPIYGGADPEFFSALSKTKSILGMMGHEVEVDMHAGCTVITKARNSIVKRFIDSGFDKLLFIDSDMVWDSVDAVKLISLGVDFSGIAYRQKTEDEKFNAVLNGEDSVELLGADRIGTGFMCLSRQCLLSMVEHYGNTRYQDDGDTYHALFDFELIDGEYWGEDYTFCRRWKAIDGDIWVLPAEIGHIGKKVYRGNIKDTL